MHSINCRGKLIDFSTPLVMGILNITQDSFYLNSRYSDEDEICKKAEQMIKEGASLIDIGGMSSRPGADIVSESEEMTRVIPIIKILISTFPHLILSVDTFRSEVAKRSIEAGASIINDISAGTLDKNMFKVISDLKVPYIIMHMRGTPQTMQKNTDYEDLILELFNFFAEKIRNLKRAGIHDIIIDPGFGFGKSLEGNFHILQKLSAFQIFECPVMVGISRKSMIYTPLGLRPETALNGTTALHMAALERGAKILRAHDVSEAVQTLKLYIELNGGNHLKC